MTSALFEMSQSFPINFIPSLILFQLISDEILFQTMRSVQFNLLILRIKQITYIIQLNLCNPFFFEFLQKLILKCMLDHILHVVWWNSGFSVWFIIQFLNWRRINLLSKLPPPKLCLWPRTETFAPRLQIGPTEIRWIIRVQSIWITAIKYILLFTQCPRRSRWSTSLLSITSYDFTKCFITDIA